MNATELIKTLELNNEIQNQIKEKTESEYDNVCAALEKCKERWNRIMREYFPDEIVSYIKTIANRSSFPIYLPDKRRWLDREENCKIELSFTRDNRMELYFKCMWRSELERRLYYDTEKKEVNFESSYLLPHEIEIDKLHEKAKSISNANELADALDKYIVTIYQKIAEISNARMENKKKELSDICNVSSETKSKKVVITIEEV